MAVRGWLSAVCFLALLAGLLLRSAASAPRSAVSGLPSAEDSRWQMAALPSRAVRSAVDSPRSVVNSPRSVVHGQWTAVCAYALNVRRGPGTEHPVTGWLVWGMSVRPSGRSSGAWIEIAEPLTGWVNARYLCRKE